MSLLLLFHPRVIAATIATGDVASDGTGTALAAGASFAATDLSAVGVGDVQTTGASIAAADWSAAGTGDAQATGAAIATGAMSADGVSAVIAVGNEPAIPDHVPQPTIPGLGGMSGRYPWTTKRKRARLERELEMDDLITLAMIASQQLARDHLARLRR